MSSQTAPEKNNTSPVGPAFRRAVGRRRRRLPSVRLGGKKPGLRFSFARACRKVKLNWLRVKYAFMLRKLRSYYASLLKDLVEERGTIESFQQRMYMEHSLAVPVLGPAIC
ncbi:hypothetical protein STAS_21971 [Striga asiatica]|uniref:Uncharacterized protein n=1 Tax=Striga asiatica TaxID=4170 RepID=A0A5A7QI39_STRAF|nr:hypothetical protein STAS_21971 [Striga asiatica]